MKKTLVAASAAALLVAGVAPTFAQADKQDKPAAERSDSDRQRGPRFSAEDRAAFTAARIAALKAGLQLTSAQEANWAGLETALRNAADERAEQRAEQRGERSRPDGLEVLNRQAERLRDQAERLTKISEAAKPLFDSLDDAQKRRFGVLLRDTLSFGPGPGPQHGAGHGPGPHKGK
ncbi:Spy/CpxP family protein refolding chaperone [Pseudochelatococcus contaminans]|uniref:LTXXQ motif family protein n=1 Tax=Pseudochelatococcus contaminans TaxID=1538103 RepID=A0A7W5Z555_9HYPH|nr:Spy/CpxP family protein refolding chaperone [Pseudochelatococcus contaminans]MBB3810030.1 hypothetical protein [Pseudochelatococcus contaminans]